METWSRLRRRSRAVPSPPKAVASTASSSEETATATATATAAADAGQHQDADLTEADRLREDAFLLHGVEDGDTDASRPSPSALKSPPNSPQDEEEEEQEAEQERLHLQQDDEVQLVSPLHRGNRPAAEEDFDEDRLVEGFGRVGRGEDGDGDDGDVDLVPPLRNLDAPFQETGPGQTLRPPLPTQPRQGGIEAKPLPRLLGFEVGSRRTAEKRTTEVSSSSSTFFANDSLKAPAQGLVQEQALLTSTTVFTPVLLPDGSEDKHRQQQPPSSQHQCKPRLQGEGKATRMRASVLDHASASASACYQNAASSGADSSAQNQNQTDRKTTSSGSGNQRRNPILQCIGLRREVGHFAAQCLGIVRSK